MLSQQVRRKAEAAVSTVPLIQSGLITTPVPTDGYVFFAKPFERAPIVIVTFNNGGAVNVQTDMISPTYFRTPALPVNSRWIAVERTD